MEGDVDDSATCGHSLPCGHQVWLHERQQRTVSVLIAHHALHNGKQMPWMSVGLGEQLGSYRYVLKR